MHVDVQVGHARGFLVEPVAAESREAEIHHARAAVIADDHVLGLEVAMDQADRVRGCEAGTGGLHDRGDLAPRPLRGLDPLAQRHAGDELHRDEHALVVESSDIEHRDHVRVREPRERLRLAEHPRALIFARGAPAGLEQLDRDLAIELGVVGAVDHAHAARAEDVEHEVATDLGAAREPRHVVRRARVLGALRGAVADVGVFRSAHLAPG